MFHQRIDKTNGHARCPFRRIICQSSPIDLTETCLQSDTYHFRTVIGLNYLRLATRGLLTSLSNFKITFLSSY
jgi:hypothetical protein